MCEERGLKRSMTTRSDLRTNGTARYNKKKKVLLKEKKGEGNKGEVRTKRVVDER